jgi:hypothetical protein
MRRARPNPFVAESVPVSTKAYDRPAAVPFALTAARVDDVPSRLENSVSKSNGGADWESVPFGVEITPVIAPL